MTDLFITITDANNKVFTLTTNAAGNFFEERDEDESLAVPVTAIIELGRQDLGDDEPRGNRRLQQQPQRSRQQRRSGPHCFAVTPANQICCARPNRIRLHACKQAASSAL